MQWTLARTDHADADTEEAASALLRCVVRDPDPANVGVNSLQRQSNSRWPAIPASPAPRRPVTVRCTACSRRAMSPPPKCHTSPCTPTARESTSRPATQTLELAPVPPFALPEPLPFGRPGERHSALIAGARSGDKGGSAQRRAVGSHRGPLAVAGAHADGREATRIAARDSRFTRHPPSVAQPVGGQLRHRRHPRAGRRVSGAVRPTGQGAGRVAAQQDHRHTCRVVQDIPESFA